MQNKSPRVSIGMPVYNSEQFLEQSLAAILTQTYSDFELIISDNASTDHTEDICRAHLARDPRIHYHRNQTNLGASKNYNMTFQLSRGEYFRWASYDDLIARDTLAKCVEVLDNEPQYIACHTRSVNIDHNGEFIEYYDDNFGFASTQPHRRFRNFLERIDDYDCNAVFGLMRRSVLEKTSLIGNYHSSDKVLLAELVLRGKFFEIPEYLFFRRFHPEMSTMKCRTEADFASWYDTSEDERPVSPTIKRTGEFLKAIHNSSLNWWQKGYCLVSIGGFYLLERKRWRRMISKSIRWASAGPA
jgi:glycosyltransferase involved in cell wall biosynthesis